MRLNSALANSVRSARGLFCQGCARSAPWEPPPFFVSVVSKELRIEVNGLESTLTGCLISVDSKGACVAPELCNCCLGSLLALDLELGSRNCRQMYLIDRIMER